MLYSLKNNIDYVSIKSMSLSLPAYYSFMAILFVAIALAIVFLIFGMYIIYSVSKSFKLATGAAQQLKTEFAESFHNIEKSFTNEVHNLNLSVVQLNNNMEKLAESNFDIKKEFESFKKTYTDDLEKLEEKVDFLQSILYRHDEHITELSTRNQGAYIARSFPTPIFTKQI